ncbi:MAG TPA: hypothetical protein VNE21_05875, partial [Mycobacteriales bacterium]|nr:hypothetical protein [Mycobacteriales bacterium]
LFLSNRPLGVATTDQAGRACLVYRAAQPPVLPVPGPGRFVRRPTALAQPLVISRPVLGVFDGTLAYRPSAARSNLVTIVASPPPSAPVPAPAAPARAVVALLLAPAAPPAPPAPPAATKVLQSVTQANPGPQPGAVGQPGAAADRQDEVESAAQTATQNLDQVAPAADTNLYRELGGASGTAPAALAGFVLAAAVLERRRRRSRVQEQTII